MANPDPERMKAFGKALLGAYTGAVLSRMIQIGYRTGLFEAAAKGPATSAELADRTKLDERYVREWLGCTTTGGLFEYDATTGQYRLPTEHEFMLTGSGATNMAPMSELVAVLTKPLDEVIACFHNGGGVPYEAYGPEFFAALHDTWQRVYDQFLVEGFLDQVPGLIDRLRTGISVLDMGCGTGHAMNLLGQAFPESRIVGYDISPVGIEAARKQAAEIGLSNVAFHIKDCTALAGDGPYDLVTSFDAIHDQIDPKAYLRAAYEVLADDGVFFAVEFHLSSHLERNIDNPFATVLYGISTMHCMTVSLAGNGAGLGTAWGVELAQEMLAEAGFRRSEVLSSPRPQNCILLAYK